MLLGLVCGVVTGLLVFWVTEVSIKGYQGYGFDKAILRSVLGLLAFVFPAVQETKGSLVSAITFFLMMFVFVAMSYSRFSSQTRQSESR